MSKLAFEDFVMSNKCSPKVTPEKTEFLGVKAAQLALDANIPLPDAVVKTASNVPGMNNTHIKNLCWAANNEYHRKVASSRKEAGEDLVFDYPLSDPNDVILKLNRLEMPKEAHVCVSSFDYSTQPEDYQTRKSCSQWHFEKESGTEEPEPFSYENPAAELGIKRQASERVYTEALNKVASYERYATDLRNDVYSQFKQAALSGSAPIEIVDLLKHASSEEEALTTFRHLAEKFAEESPLDYERFSKTAPQESLGRPNRQHPLYKSASALQDILEDKGMLSHVLDVAKHRYEAYKEAEQKAFNLVNNKEAGIDHILAGSALGAGTALATGHSDKALEGAIVGGLVGTGIKAKGHKIYSGISGYSPSRVLRAGLGSAGAYYGGKHIMGAPSKDVGTAQRYGASMARQSAITPGKWR
jgi:hypothetical protein